MLFALGLSKAIILDTLEVPVLPRCLGTFHPATQVSRPDLIGDSGASPSSGMILEADKGQDGLGALFTGIFGAEMRQV